MLWLAVAMIKNAQNITRASIKFVAILVLCLILVLPMLCAKLFIIQQNVLVLQVTLVIHKLSVNHHVRDLKINNKYLGI